MGEKGRIRNEDVKHRKVPAAGGSAVEGREQGTRADRGSVAAAVEHFTGFRIVHVEWRLDTILTNMLLVITVIVCSSMVIERLSTNGAATRETIKQMTLEMQKNNVGAHELVDRLDQVEKKQEELKSNLTDNFKAVVGIKESLEKEKKRRVP